MRAALRLVDDSVARRVLVYGTLPPAGRDLDVLVHDEDMQHLESALAADGYVARDGVWARFGGDPASVDVTPASDWGLTERELDALFADGVPLDGCAHVVRPSAHHELLVLARRAAVGALTPLRRVRTDTYGGETIGLARRHAPAWGVAVELEELLQVGRPALRTAPPLVAAELRRRILRARRGVVVSFSGLDGAGKSGQAAALRDALRVVGVDAHVEWLPFGQNASIERMSAVARSVLRLLRRFGRGPTKVERRVAAGESLFATPGSTRSRGAKGEAVLFLWTTAVALANALHQRRVATTQAALGRLVIFDRYTVDSIVRLRYLYGHERRFAFQSLLIRAVSPRPLRSYFLDVAPETALARKDDRWSLGDLRRQAELYREESARHGVVRLDGERPADELAAEVAAEVWSALD